MKLPNFGFYLNILIMKTSGIYKIVNKLNHKTYYGSSVYCENRWNTHKWKLSRNSHGNPYLQNAWNKYGADAFKFEIVKEIPTEQLVDIEQQYLNSIKTNPRLFYNIGNNAECWNRGNPLSGKHKEKISKSNKGHIVSKETRNKISNAIIGNKNFWYGKHFTSNHKKLISKSMKGKNTWMKGRPALNRDKTMYLFRNNVTNEIFTGMRVDFQKKYNLSQGNISSIINGKRKSHKDWILIQ